MYENKYGNAMNSHLKTTSVNHDYFVRAVNINRLNGGFVRIT